MYGYVVPDKPNMYVKDFNTFRACYCGLCKALGKSGAQITRFVTNYDCTFLYAFVHSVTKTELQVSPERCVLSAKKKPIAARNELGLRVADATVLLAYFKALDDAIDGDGKKNLVRLVLSRRMARAKKNLPNTYATAQAEYARLRELEKAEFDGIDRLADCFSLILVAVVKELVGDCFNADISDLAYNLGRWIYIIDAIDDVEEDSKKHRFNPLLCGTKCDSKAEYLERNAEELTFLVNSCYNKIVSAYNALDITICEGVLSNTVYLGLPTVAENVLGGKEKCRTIRL